MIEAGVPLLFAGFKSSGKSTIGRMVAGELGRTFLDLDQVIIDRYEDEQGEWLTFREIFEREGAEAFRRFEYEAAKDVAGRDDLIAGGLVLALGGGTLMESGTREVLAGLGRVVYLRTPFPAILRRVERRGWPAYVADEPDPAAALEAIMHEREPVYLDAADVVVDLPARSSKVRTMYLVLEAIENAASAGWPDIKAGGSERDSV